MFSTLIGLFLECRWGCLVTFLVPAVGAIVWFGLIPVDSPTDKHAEKSLKWTFLIHPFTMTFLAYLLVALFNTALDSSWPNRPFLTYFHILVVNYVVQVRCNIVDGGHALCDVICQHCREQSFSIKSAHLLTIHTPMLCRWHNVQPVEMIFMTIRETM
jgi:hypothetical protein